MGIGEGKHFELACITREELLHHDVEGAEGKQAVLRVLNPQCGGKLPYDRLELGPRRNDARGHELLVCVEGVGEPRLLLVAVDVALILLAAGLNDQLKRGKSYLELEVEVESEAHTEVVVLELVVELLDELKVHAPALLRACDDRLEQP